MFGRSKLLPKSIYNHWDFIYLNKLFSFDQVNMESVFEKIPELNADHVRMKDRKLVAEKLANIAKGGKSLLQIITDFDRTISKHFNNGALSKSSYCVFEAIPTLPPSFVENATSLYSRFRVIEDNPNMSIEEKIPYMEEWWKLNERLFIGLPFKQDEIDQAVIDSQVVLRDGTGDAFQTLQEHNVPVLVFSAGLGNVVESMLRHNNLKLSNVHVISNFFKVENNTIVGFQGKLMHVYNKNQHAVENCDYFEDLSHRPNVILMGDSLGDSAMAEGVQGDGSILKIGFLSVTIDEYLPQYLDRFDIVLLNDQTMNVFNAILKFVLS